MRQPFYAQRVMAHALLCGNNHAAEQAMKASRDPVKAALGWVGGLERPRAGYTQALQSLQSFGRSFDWLGLRLHLAVLLLAWCRQSTTRQAGISLGGAYTPG